MRRVLPTTASRCLRLGLLICAACGAVDGSTLDRVRREGFVRVGYATEEPYAFVAQGRVTGEAPELTRVLLGRLGIDSIVWIQREFGALIPELNQGRFDIVAAGMFVTADRERQVTFTLSSFCVGPELIVRRDNPRGLHSYEDIRDDSVARLAVLDGAVEQRIARLVGIPISRVVAVPDERTGVAAVRLGRVDALALSAPTVNRLVRGDPEGRLERAEPFAEPGGGVPSAGGCGALAVRKNDRHLLDALNRELRRFVGSADHLRLADPFGFTPDELPPWVKAP